MMLQTKVGIYQRIAPALMIHSPHGAFLMVHFSCYLLSAQARHARQPARLRLLQPLHADLRPLGQYAHDVRAHPGDRFGRGRRHLRDGGLRGEARGGAESAGRRRGDDEGDRRGPHRFHARRPGGLRADRLRAGDGRHDLPAVLGYDVRRAVPVHGLCDDALSGDGGACPEEGVAGEGAVQGFQRPLRPYP